MSKFKSLLIAVFFSALSLAPAAAQVADVVARGLETKDVLKDGEYIFASASGAIRGTRETSERFYVTRALSKVAIYLCDFHAVPGKKLEAVVRGATLVDSRLEGTLLKVVIKVPLQDPSCMEKSSKPGTQLKSEQIYALPNDQERAVELRDVQYGRSENIVIRTFGIDY